MILLCEPVCSSDAGAAEGQFKTSFTHPCACHHILQALRALRHYERQLSLSATLALRQAASSSAAAWRRALVMDARRMFLQMGRSLQAWHETAMWLSRSDPHFGSDPHSSADFKFSTPGGGEVPLSSS